MCNVIVIHMNKLTLKTVALDGKVLDSPDHLLAAFKDAFLYLPEYGGSNLDACIDILSSLRFSDEERMSTFQLTRDEAIALQVKNYDAVSQATKEALATIVGAVNALAQDMGQSPLIYILLNENI